MDKQKQQQNEKKFGSWEELFDGGRRYWYEVEGRYGWKARYVKEVDVYEVTRRFYQEIYNNYGDLVEVHWKYPVDRGHQEVK
ncbi:MAG: hypothetical protein QME81_15360 [bacterium]|nr:hypothetical protein [bacterium]